MGQSIQSAFPAASHVTAVGASAGGLKAIRTFLSNLPDDFSAPIIVAMHSGETRTLPDILGKSTHMTVQVVTDGTPLASGFVYVCPGGQDTYLADGFLRVTGKLSDPLFRPSINLLFESLARQYRHRAIAIVMSGMLNDGTEGALRVHEFGATMLVQTPDEASFESMPSSVIMNDHPRNILPASALADEVVRIVVG